ncbi:MAG: hypothetical protein ACI83D_000543 [Planctomycetota bacterium]
MAHVSSKPLKFDFRGLEFQNFIWMREPLEFDPEEFGGIPLVILGIVPSK